MGKELGWVEVLNGDWAGPLRLRVQGRSMWPTLRPGDQVTVEPVSPDDLQTGDWVLLEGQNGLFIHRLLGFTQEGMLLAKGDGHRAPDPPWPPAALRGRAIALSRQGRLVPISPTSARERIRTAAHRSMARIWSLLKCAGLIAVVLLVIAPPISMAAVDLVSFEATPDLAQGHILVTWETASEVKMLGFELQRADGADGDYQPIAWLFAEGGVLGASYQFIDSDVVLDQTYYYRLEAVETDDSSEFHGPIWATFAPTPTPTPTSTPTATNTPRPILPPPPAGESTATPTSPPTTPTSTPTRRPTRTLPPTKTPTATSSSTDTQPAKVTSPSGASAPSPTDTATSAPAGDPGSISTPTSTPTATPQPVAAARTRSLSPSPSPTPTRRSTVPHGASSKEGRSLPWGLLLLIIILIGLSSTLLGGWYFWRTRGRQ